MVWERGIVIAILATFINDSIAMERGFIWSMDNNILLTFLMLDFRISVSYWG
jgi:hypothetical protein